MREVVIATEEVRLEDVTTSKGYAFTGVKGTFILAKDTEKKFIWVRLTPSKLSSPVHQYNTIKDAIKDKIDNGFTVFEYDDAELV